MYSHVPIESLRDEVDREIVATVSQQFAREHENASHFSVGVHQNNKASAHSTDALPSNRRVTPATSKAITTTMPKAIAETLHFCMFDGVCMISDASEEARAYGACIGDVVTRINSKRISSNMEPERIVHIVETTHGQHSRESTDLLLNRQVDVTSDMNGMACVKAQMRCRDSISVHRKRCEGAARTHQQRAHAPGVCQSNLGLRTDSDVVQMPSSIDS